jgi:hypothetical protein
VIGQSLIHNNRYLGRLEKLQAWVSFFFYLFVFTSFCIDVPYFFIKIHVSLTAHCLMDEITNIGMRRANFKTSYRIFNPTFNN